VEVHVRHLLVGELAVVLQHVVVGCAGRKHDGPV
jgi:hypothetical protein